MNFIEIKSRYNQFVTNTASSEKNKPQDQQQSSAAKPHEANSKASEHTSKTNRWDKTERRSGKDRRDKSQAGKKGINRRLDSRCKKDRRAPSVTIQA